MVLATLATVVACTAPDTDSESQPGPSGTGSADTEPAATAEEPKSQALVAWDDWGVPHIWGSDRESAWFAMGWAQAETDIVRVRTNHMAATARLSEFGLGTAESDITTLSLRVPQTAREHYDDLAETTRQALESYAGGVNAWMEAHPDRTPEWAGEVEAWEVAAHLNHGPLLEQGLTVRDKVRGTDPDPQGSNVWAIGASRSTTGQAMLGGQPQTPFDSIEGPRWEYHIAYPGVNAVGAGTLGAPGITVGGTEHVAWSGTNNLAHFASADAYRLTTDPTEHPGAYLFDGEWLAFEEETHQVGPPEARQEVTLRSSRHGPVVEAGGGQTFAARLSYLDDVHRPDLAVGLLEARDMDEVRDQLVTWTPRANVVVADHEGNLFYVYAVKAGIRPEGPYDWASAVDGSTSATEWQGIVAFDDLPQILNPPGDVLVNANDGPDGTLPGALDPSDYPDWLVWLGGETDRGTRLRELANAPGPVDLDQMETIAFDVHIPSAADLVPVIGQAWAAHGESYEADDRQRGDAAVADLASWDLRATTDSTAMTVYTAWALALGRSGHRLGFDSTKPVPEGTATGSDGAAIAEALVVGTAELERSKGSIAVPWGEIHQVARGEFRAPAAGGWNNTWMGRLRPGAGSVFEGHLTEVDDPVAPSQFLVSSGSSYVFVTETGAGGGFRSIHPWGNATDPTDPHYFDQASSWGSLQAKDMHRGDPAATLAVAEALVVCTIDAGTCTEDLEGDPLHPDHPLAETLADAG